jgi:general secretion pathway protein K
MEHVGAKASADAAINDAIIRLLDDSKRQRPNVAGAPYTFQFGGRAIMVSIQDESGKVDLNAADWNTLTHVFATEGLDLTAAQTLADRVTDWRDNDNDRRPNGAEVDDYRSAGRKFLPRNAPFQRVDELRLVMGVQGAFYRKLAPIVTVYSHRPYINMATAPEIVRTALQGLEGDSSMVVNIGADPTGQSSAAIVNGVVGPSISLAGWSFTIRAQVPLASGAGFVREVVVGFTGNPQQQYWLENDWQIWESAEHSKSR